MSIGPATESEVLRCARGLPRGPCLEVHTVGPDDGGIPGDEPVTVGGRPGC
jgi:hypothetical protein